MQLGRPCWYPEVVGTLEARRLRRFGSAWALAVMGAPLLACASSVSEVDPDASGSAATDSSTGATNGSPTSTSSVSDATTVATSSGVDTGSGPDTQTTSPTTDPSGSETGGGCQALWWNTDWVTRLPLSIPADRVDADLAEVPILVVLNGERLDHLPLTPAELRFVDAAGNPRAHEVEHWAYPDDSWVWVRVPALSQRQDTRLHLYFGSSDVPDVADPPAVWSNYLAVLHFADDLQDSTGAHDGTSPSPPGFGTGAVGTGARFDGLDDYLDLPSENDFDLANAITISLWMRTAGWTFMWETLVAKGDDSWRLHRDELTSQLEFANHIDAAWTHDLEGALAVDDDVWHFVTAVFDGNTKVLFVDGEIDAMGPFDGHLPSSGYPVRIGDNSQAVGRFFTGGMDEVRISGIPRSPAWVRVQYRSMTDALIDYGAVETCP